VQICGHHVSQVFFFRPVASSESEFVCVGVASGVDSKAHCHHTLFDNACWCRFCIILLEFAN
jgi:hypothetical protein